MSDTTTKTIELGTLITDRHGNEYAYGGQLDSAHARQGGSTITFGIGRGGPSVMHCDPRDVMPSEDVPATLNTKDSRITVANDKAGRPGTWVGPWRVQIPGDVFASWHRTKSAAVESAAVRLAIREWWAA